MAVDWGAVHERLRNTPPQRFEDHPVVFLPPSEWLAYQEQRKRDLAAWEQWQLDRERRKLLDTLTQRDLPARIAGTAKDKSNWPEKQ